MDKMPIVDPALNQLRDIHLPPPIGIWPIAIGWYLLALLLLIAGILFYFRHRRRRVKRRALQILADYERQYRNHGPKEMPAEETVAKIADLLRRVALAYFPRETVAGLEGQAWLDFLNRTSRGLDFNVLANVLLELPYQKTKSGQKADLNGLFSSAKSWVKQRRAHV